MKRVKTFLLYALMIIVTYILVSYMSYGFISKTYKNIEEYEILANSPAVQIVENKASYVSGYIIGRVTNNTDALIDSIYLKIDLYNKRDNYMGTKYVHLEDFQVNQVKEFKVNFKYDAIERYTIDFEEEPSVVIEEEVLDHEPFWKFLGFASILLFIYYILP